MGRNIDLFRDSQNIFEPFNFTSTGQTVFTLPAAGEPVVFVGGAIQRKTIDFTVSGTTLTFTSTIANGINVTGYVLEFVRNVPTNVDFTVDSFNGNGNTTNFTLSQSVPAENSVLVSITGVVQSPGDSYTVSDTTLTFTTAPPIGTDNIVVINLSTESAIDEPGDGTVTFAKLSSNNKKAIHRKNYLINSNFDFWQRGISFTTAPIYTTDRWRADFVDGTSDTSRQLFTLGQTDVPNEPTYFARTTLTTGGLVGSFHMVSQRVEGVRSLAGKQVTLSFWAKADVAKNIATEVTQFFGTSGTPSASVNAIGVTTHALTTSWQKFTANIIIPGISGKILGTDNNDYLEIIFWFEAGSDFDSRTNSLGTQSGTFDIAQVQLEEGIIDTNFEFRPFEEELALCQRYYEKSYNINIDPGSINDLGVENFRIPTSGGAQTMESTHLKITKRAIPAITLFSSVTGASGMVANINTATDDLGSANNIGEKRFISTHNQTSTSGHQIEWHWTADAEL